MRILGIIPARYASTRFPGKPLVMISGKSMIQRVYEQAMKCQYLDMVIVATDHQSIFNHVNQFGGRVVITGTSHRSGTERCHEVVQLLAAENSFFDAVINIQGDEPFIDPGQIGQVAEAFSENGAEIVTLVRKITRGESITDQNVVKVVVQKGGDALFFSRSPIPFVRGVQPAEWIERSNFLEHVGIYGYSCNTLKKIVELSPSSLEQAESLEQLRWLENGFHIHTKMTSFESISIDIPEDLLKITNKA